MQCNVIHYLWLVNLYVLLSVWNGYAVIWIVYIAFPCHLLCIASFIPEWGLAVCIVIDMYVFLGCAWLPMIKNSLARLVMTDPVLFREGRGGVCPSRVCGLPCGHGAGTRLSARSGAVWGRAQSASSCVLDMGMYLRMCFGRIFGCMAADISVCRWLLRIMRD
jgi:hypothetical protein